MVMLMGLYFSFLLTTSCYGLVSRTTVSFLCTIAPFYENFIGVKCFYITNGKMSSLPPDSEALSKDPGFGHVFLLNIVDNQKNPDCDSLCYRDWQFRVGRYVEFVSKPSNL